VLQVVPLAEVEVDPKVVRLPNGQAEVTLRGHVNPPAAGVTEAALSMAGPAWLALQPDSATVGLAFVRKIRLSLKEAPEKAAGTLAVTVKAGALTQNVPFKLDLSPSSVVVRRLDDPAWTFEWGIAFRNQAEQPGDTKTGAVFIRQPENVVGGVNKPGLFSHPPYNGGFGYSFAAFAPIQLPAEPAEVHLFIGLGDGGDPSDGVDYTILVRDAQGKETKLLAEHGEQKHWREVTADLSAFAGQKVEFKLVADCGAKDNTVADWACWGDPEIRLKKPVPEVRIGR